MRFYSAQGQIYALLTSIDVISAYRVKTSARLILCQRLTNDSSGQSTNEMNASRKKGKWQIKSPVKPVRERELADVKAERNIRQKMKELRKIERKIEQLHDEKDNNTFAKRNYVDLLVQRYFVLR